MALARTDDEITLISYDPCLQNPQRDPFPPVSRLPAEILANVFIHNAHNYYIHEIYGHPKLATPSWVNVSYVCRYWRDIALNCQILWSYIPTTSQRWTQELLARSQKAPLKICIGRNLDVNCADRSYVLSIVEQLTNHLQRIQGLYLDFKDITEEDHYHTLSKLLSSRLPCLQRLQIFNLTLLDEEDLFPLEGDTPALHTLILEDCCMQWNSLELSGLTTLHLHSVELPFPQNITITDFLAMLRHMPDLAQLSVHDTLPRVHDVLPSGEFNAASIINLPHLSNMSIKAPVSTVNTPLSCVGIPLTTNVELDCEFSFESTHDDITLLASLLAQRINPSYDPALAVPKFRLLTIDSDNRFNAMLAFSTSEHRHPFPSSLDTRLLVCFSVDAESTRLHAIINHMCCSIPLTSIQSIHFDGSYLDFCRDTLVSFPNIRHIKLSGDYTPDIASILSLPTHDHSGDNDNPIDGDQNEISVPSLEELELYNIIFPSVDSLRSDLDALCKAISTRKETQCRLVIKRCSVATTDGRLEVLELVGWWDRVAHLTYQYRNSFT